MLQTLLGILGVILLLYICYYQGSADLKAHQASRELPELNKRIDTLQRQVNDLKRELEEMKRKIT